MSDLIKRLGISALSKSNVSSAYNEEIMVDKNTGEFLIKTKEGDTVSYIHNARIKSAIDYLVNESDSKSLFGDIYQLDLGEGVFPLTIEPNVNILTDTESISTNYTKFMIYIDLTSLSVNTDGFSYKDNDCQVSIDFTVSYTDGTTSDTMTITDRNYLISHNVYDLTNNSMFPNINTAKTINAINITSIKVLNKRYDYPTLSIVDDDNLRNIIHSVSIIVG